MATPMARNHTRGGGANINKPRFGIVPQHSGGIRDVSKRAREFHSIDHLGQIERMGWAKLATYYYDVTQFELPFTPDEFDQNFQGIRRVFSLLDPAALQGRQTNAAVGSGVNEIFVAVGAGVVAIGEDKSFLALGAAMDRPVSGTTVCTPSFEECVGPDQAVAGPSAEDPDALGIGARNATFWWGGPTWEFIDKFFNHYRLQIYANRRFQMVDESLFDVGMVPAPPEFIGAGDSAAPVRPFLRATNDVMADKGINKIFITPTIDETGSLCIAPAAASVTWGHPRITGLANRIYCFYQPLVMIPGMQFDVEFVPVENDICNLDHMRMVSVLDETAPTTMDAQLTEDLCDTTANAFGSEFMVPGGCIHLGVVLKGFSLQPLACVEYLVDYITGGNRMPLSEVYGRALLEGLDASLVRNLLEQAKDEKNAQARADLSGIHEKMSNRLAGIVAKAQQGQG